MANRNEEMLYKDFCAYYKSLRNARKLPQGAPPMCTAVNECDGSTNNCPLRRGSDNMSTAGDRQQDRAVSQLEYNKNHSRSVLN